MVSSLEWTRNRALEKVRRAKAQRSKWPRRGSPSSGVPSSAGGSRHLEAAAIVERVNAGETEEEIAKDYGLDYEEVKEALVYEQAA